MCLCVYMFVCGYVCMCVYISICMYIYIYTESIIMSICLWDNVVGCQFLIWNI